jgi:hypothetical protein
MNGVVFAAYGMFLNILVAKAGDTPTLFQVTVAAFGAGLVVA